MEQVSPTLNILLLRIVILIDIRQISAVYRVIEL